MNNMVELERVLNLMRPQIQGWSPHWVYANMAEWVTNGGTWGEPLQSTSWDGDAHSTVATLTKIDLSAVFGVPAGVKAIYVNVELNDSGSAASNVYLGLSPNSAGTNGIYVGPAGMTNDAKSRDAIIVPCDANGDIWYRCAASGTNTLDITLRIWGYLI